jgi:hypothetical protein
MMRKWKPLMAWAFLSMGLLATLALAYDATHPVITEDACTVVAVGTPVTALREGYKMLYRNGSNPLHDVALRCKTQGPLWLNEAQPFGVSTAKGQPASLRIKRYHWLPLQQHVQVGQIITPPVKAG